MTSRRDYIAISYIAQVSPVVTSLFCRLNSVESEAK